MCTALDITIVSYDTLKVCYQKFKIKDYDIQEEELLGQPTDDGEAHLQEVVEKDQHSTTWEFAMELDISAMSISRAVHHINLAYNFYYWLPHDLIQVTRTDMFSLH